MLTTNSIASNKLYLRGAKLLVGCLLFQTGWLLTSASGLTVNLVQAPAGTTLNPVYDPNLVQLGNIMQAAANYWESIILTNHNVTVTYGYANLGPSTHGLAEVTATNGSNRATAGNVAFDIENNMAGDWFFDSSPTNHSEFSMHQVLYRDLANNTQTLYYNGSPKDVLEVGYWGNYIGANQGRDALTNAIHELGHILGLSQAIPDFNTQIGDGDFDFNPLFTQLAGAAVHYHGPAVQDRDHVRSSDSLMAVGAGNGDRNLPSATDLFAMASVSNWAIDLPRKDFWGGAANWNTSFNWPGNRVPDAQDAVHVRNGATASLTTANGQAGSMWIQEDSVVNTGANTLNVTSTLTIEGVNAGEQANLVVNSNGRVVADTIRLNQGGLLTLTSGATEEVNANLIDINSGGVLLGNGDVGINSSLVNDGTISAIAGAGQELALLGGPVDLDGASGNGEVFAVLGNLRISASLTDAFDGQMTIGAGHQVRKFGSWQFGTNNNGQLKIQGSAVDYATLDQANSSVTFNSGTLSATGLAQINGSKSFNQNYVVQVASGGDLRLNGITTFNGGTYGGAGMFRFNGPVTVAANTAMTFGVVDMDGANGNTVTTLDQSRLTLQVDRINAGDIFNNIYQGTLNVNGSNAGLTVNLNNNPNVTWQMLGTLNANGSLGTRQQTLEGSPVLMSGTINAAGNVEFSAPMDVVGTIALNSSSSEVWLSQATHRIHSTASITGDGQIVIASDGTVLAGHESTIDAEVYSLGRFEPGFSIGTARVNDDYSQLESATLGIELSGAPGTNQDLLQVTGIANLDGELEVTVLDGAIPTLGSVYTLLTAASVAGTFDAFTLQSDTLFQYQATLGYPGTRVTLRFTDISMFGDFNDDLTLDCADVDALVGEIASGGVGMQFDLNGDTMVNIADLNLWLDEAGTFNVGGPYLGGDANLDGFVDGADFITWNAHKFMNAPAWCRGDFNADGFVDGTDFIIWNSNKFMSSDSVSAVPEPAAWSLILWTIGILGARYLRKPVGI